MRRLLVVLLGGAGLAWALSGAPLAKEPGVFAIKDARIVPVAGPVLDRGTVVIAGGAIVAVGTTVAVPPEAWIIDGNGLTVYPGLIDALSDLGLAGPTPPAGPPSGAAGGAPGGVPRGPAARGPEDRPGSTPWVQAADELKSDDRRLESWRSAGFTAALSAPKTGLLPGQGAVVALAGERPGDMVVRAPATLQIGLSPTGGFGSFPGSLMGVVAYLRQVFLDAEHDLRAVKAYDAGQRGVERPEYDRTVRALQQARAANLPAMMPAQTPTQIVRALDLARELSLSPIIVGGHHAAAVTEQLAAARAAVVVSLKWPERDANGDPDAVEPLRVLRLRAGAPAVPAALERAGVPFAFALDGVQPRDARKSVRRAIDAGLDPDAALRALTLAPARILGVSARLGSLEPGKAAHLVITDGDLFAEKTKVKMTFVDGVKFDAVERTTPAGNAKPEVTLTGRWTLTLTTPQGTQTPVAELAQGEDGSLTGTLTSPAGTLALTNGSVSGTGFTFSVTMPIGGSPTTLTFSGTAESGSLKGTMSAGAFTGEFTGVKAGPSQE